MSTSEPVKRIDPDGSEIKPQLHMDRGDDIHSFGTVNMVIDEDGSVEDLETIEPEKTAEEAPHLDAPEQESEGDAPVFDPDQEDQSGTTEEKSAPIKVNRAARFKQDTAALKAERIRIKKKKRRKWIILSLVLLVLLLIGATAGYIIYRFFENVRPEVTIEAGSGAPRPEDFLYEKRESTVCDTDLSQIDTKIPGEHIIRFSWGFLHTESKLIIRDTVPPVGEVQDLLITLGERPKAEDFVTFREDVTDIKVRYAIEPDFLRTGETMVNIILEDTGGNLTVLKAKLTIYDVNKVPVIHGVEDQNLYVGDSVSYRSGVTVTADDDEDPKLTIDNSQVNLDMPGTYPVTYTATDRYGRTSSVTATIRVSRKPENYGDILQLEALADETLSTLIADNMTDIEKLFQIFRFCRLNIPWIRTGSHENEIEQATRGLEGNSGDCFTHAVACRALLDRAGYVCTMIEKKNETGTHYWLMVYLDGNWYHMDPSPIYVTNFNAFLATDAQLKEWADKWRPHLYELDQNPYPATPMTSPVEVVYMNGEYYLNILSN